MSNKKLLIIGHVWPEPRSSAAGARMMQLILCFKQESYEIIFASACAKTERAFDLSSMGIVQAHIQMNHSSFDQFVKSYNPDVVIFDRFMTEEQFGWRVAENCPNALRILDTEDLHCLRKGRQKALKDNQDFSESYLFNDVSKREIASIYRCDLSLIISEKEMALLKNKFNVSANLLHYLPFQCEMVSDELIQNLPKFDERQHFITIGNFLHEPNYDAAIFLKDVIWPLIRKKLPQAQLHIYGAYASPKVNQMHHEESGFLIKGFADDVGVVMRQAKVCLAPLRFGAGLKGKLVDAMQNGTPSVMTSIAAEAMFGKMEMSGLVADTGSEFAEQAVLLYENETLWKQKQSFGFLVLSQRFDKLLFHDSLFDKVKSRVLDLAQHRRQNFVGQMLQHQMLHSTKYMSKWIEEKNKE